MPYEILVNVLVVVISVSIVGISFYIDYLVLVKKRIVLFRASLPLLALLLILIVVSIMEYFIDGVILSVLPISLIVLEFLWALLCLWWLHLSRKTYFFYGSPDGLKESIMNTLDEMKIKYKNYDYSNEIFLPDINNFIKITKRFDKTSEILLEKGKDMPFFKELIKEIKKYYGKKEIKPAGGFYLWYLPISTIIVVVFWLTVLL